MIKINESFDILDELHRFKYWREVKSLDTLSKSDRKSLEYNLKSALKNDQSKPQHIIASALKTVDNILYRNGLISNKYY